MQLYKRRIPLAIVFIMGVGLIICYYIPLKTSDDILNESMKWVRIIAAFSLVIGVYSLMRSHYIKISKQSSGWAYSIVMFIFLIITLIAGFGWGSKGKSFQWIFDWINVPASATVFSILAFYIASAAYRAFRARNVEAAVMLIAAIIVMVGRIPFGDMISEKLPPSLNFLGPAKLVDWLMNQPGMAARRAIMLGISLSVIATSMRIIFGIERTYMGGKD